MPLSVDSHENIELQLLLEQLVPVSREQLNQFGMGDFMWTDCHGEITSLEGKQITELLGSIDSVEEQLSRQIRGNMAHHYGLIVRGVALPHRDGIATYQWSKTKDGRQVAYENRVVHQSYKGYRAWLHRLVAMGLMVVEVPSTEAMAVQLAAMYLNDQEERHDTLQRHIYVKPPVFNPQDAVVTLMAFPGIGEDKALALVGRTVDVETGEISYNKYGSLWELLHADPKDIASVPGVGKETVRKLFAALGRVE